MNWCHLQHEADDRQLNFLGTVTVPIDADNFADHKKKRGIVFDKDDANLRKFFPPVDVGEVNDPAVIVDAWGRILAWHLPDIISTGRVVRRIYCFEMDTAP
jgi:hypothetical protein